MQLKTVVPRTTSRLDLWRRLIDRALERALPKASAIPPVVHEGMRYCVFSGGKRFRPLLCLGAAAAVGAPSRVALPVACALELIHTYSLVHDDLPAMDNADQRRGQPACHRKFGEGNAILIGDALLTLAFDLMSRHEMPNALAIIHTVSTACGTTGLIGGQVLDLQAISRPHGASEETLKEIARWKTGALIGASVVSGGLAGSANSHQIKYLQGYGRNIGLAFQLIDDIHDREGFVNRLGLDEARAQAHNLIAHAIDMVKPFGTEAAGLRQIAQWLASTAS
ncbi:MAG: polyprenyl synthetase family protein [Candidatus Omnitrophica bacterium]|nr:polyprenyl synthetase family protein [Candidatus Omnitrophota bacterium]